jgi:hypothetical protein
LPPYSELNGSSPQGPAEWFVSARRSGSKGSRRAFRKSNRSGASHATGHMGHAPFTPPRWCASTSPSRDVSREFAEREPHVRARASEPHAACQAVRLHLLQSAQAADVHARRASAVHDAGIRNPGLANLMLEHRRALGIALRLNASVPVMASAMFSTRCIEVTSRATRSACSRRGSARARRRRRSPWPCSWYGAHRRWSRPSARWRSARWSCSRARHAAAAPAVDRTDRSVGSQLSISPPV